MESVYDRLKDEIKEQILKNVAKYPLTFNSVVNELKENINYLHVSYVIFSILQGVATELDWEAKDKTHFQDFLKD